MAATGGIVDAVSIIGILLAQKWLHENREGYQTPS